MYLCMYVCMYVCMHVVCCRGQFFDKHLKYIKQFSGFVPFQRSHNDYTYLIKVCSYLLLFITIQMTPNDLRHGSIDVQYIFGLASCIFFSSLNKELSVSSCLPVE